MIKRKALFLPMLLTMAVPAMAQRVPTRMNQLPMTTPDAMLQSKAVGHKTSTDILHLAISIPYADAAAMQKFADSVSDPKSPDYGHFITPDEIGTRFGQSAANVQKVADYLTLQGMTIKLVAKNRLTILADATVAQAEAAFDVTISNFTKAATSATPAESFYSYTTVPSVPASIAPYVMDVSGLESYTRPKPRYELPDQIRTLYAVKPMYDDGFKGQGRTIAISSWDGFRLTNLPPFYTQFALPAPAGGVGSNVTVKTVNGGSGSGQQQGEADLDIQAILGVAPLCNLVIYDGGGGSLLQVLALEANDNISDIISESYGWRFGSQSTGLAAHNIHLAMTAQGITYMAASGDSGTSVSSFPYPNYDPEVLMVGGTTVSTDAAGNRISETGWSGSGGGWYNSTDTFNLLPSWLKGPGIPTNINKRIFPDVALDADPNTGYVVYINNGFYVIGGTSGASPTYAAGLGVVSQKTGGTQRFGRIQDLLYSYQGDSTIFFDVTSGSNGKLPDNTTSNAKVGWDMVTGWGAFNFNGFAAKVATKPYIKSLTASVASIEGGSASKIIFTVTLASPAPTGGAVLNMTSTDASIPVPATITVPANKTTMTCAVATTVTAPSKTVRVSASTSQNMAFTNISVVSPHPISVRFSPSAAIGGSSTVVTATVTMDKAAPTGGMTVNLSSDAPGIASIPSTVTIPATQTTATFRVNHVAVGAVTPVHISGVSGGITATGTFTVNPPSLTTLKLSMGSALAGVTVTGTVTISNPAPAAGLPIGLSVSSAAATLSTPTLTIAPGATTGTFTVTTNPVNTTTVVSVKAAFGAMVKPANLTVKSPSISSIATSAASALGGVDNPTITVTLDSPAGPSGASVTLAVNPATAGSFTNSTLVVPSGSKTASAVMHTAAVNANVSSKVTGTLGVTKTAYVAVLAAKITSFTATPSTVKGGSPVTFKVTLDGPAGPGGRVVTLTSMMASVLAVPATVTVPAGATTVSFAATPVKVTATKSVVVKAKVGTITLMTTLTVNP